MRLQIDWYRDGHFGRATRVREYRSITFSTTPLPS
jgi:hypothetical protein